MSIPELKKILLAEDEPDIRLVTRMSLEKLGGFQVEPCESGVVALHRIGEFVPELILLDVMMPEMDGPTTLMNIRKMEEFSKTPVIFLTAKVQPHEIRHYKDLGALDVITKPFEPVLLASQIRELWANWHLAGGDQ